MSHPLPSGFDGYMIFSPSRNFRPDRSSISLIELSTPLVTSSNGASTVVGASPRKVWRYSPPTISIRIALVVVEPQSVARITLRLGSFFSTIKTVPQKQSLVVQFLQPRNEEFYGLSFLYSAHENPVAVGFPD